MIKQVDQNVLSLVCHCYGVNNIHYLALPCRSWSPNYSVLVPFTPYDKIRHNEKDSPTVDLTIWPLSGAITASPLLNSNGGAKVKTSGNLGDFTLFNCLSTH
jgi:hypothetical protein